MPIGPVEYVVLGFPGNKFRGEIVPELAKLVDKGTIRVLDLIFIGKDAAGNLVSFEFDQVDELAPFAAMDGEVGGLVSAEDIDHAAALLEPNSSAACSCGRTSGRRRWSIRCAALTACSSKVPASPMS
jgi:Family of unknown function (DUF6325)